MWLLADHIVLFISLIIVFLSGDLGELLFIILLSYAIGFFSLPLDLIVSWAIDFRAVIFQIAIFSVMLLFLWLWKD